MYFIYLLFDCIILEYQIIMRTSSTSQPKKIKKVINSPQKHFVTGLTENKIPTAQMMPSNTMIPANTISTPPVNPQVDLNPTRGKFNLNKLGLTYEGSLVNNTLHGQGVLYNANDPNRYVYKGHWAYGSRNGFGHYIYPDGSQYRGEWKNNQKQGQGIYFNKQGQKYEGYWQNNRRHGQGIMQFQNKTTLAGNWMNDEFVEGVVTYPDGGRYQGQMKQFYRNGRGIYNYPDRTKYDGQWSKNMKNGESKILYSNGDQFNGNFRQNKKHGLNSQYLFKKESYLLSNGVYNNDRIQSGILEKVVLQ